MPNFVAAVRHYDGSKATYTVEDAPDFQAARQFVFQSLSPQPRAVLVAECAKPFEITLRTDAPEAA